MVGRTCTTQSLDLSYAFEHNHVGLKFLVLYMCMHGDHDLVKLVADLQVAHVHCTLCIIIWHIMSRAVCLLIGAADCCASMKQNGCCAKRGICCEL